MKQHGFDVVSFIFGTTFVTLAAVLSLTHTDLGTRWIAWGGGAVLIAAGLSLVLGSRRSLQNGSDEER